MDTKRIIPILILSFLSACLPKDDVVTPGIQASTDVPIATITTLPVVTAAAPSLTSTPSVQTEGGSSLIYEKIVDDQKMIVVMDADGNLTTTHPLPAGAELSDFSSSISPDGQWLVYYLGSAELQSADGFELSLNLLNLSDGQTQSLTSLLSADYPENFQEATDELARQGIAIMNGVDTQIFLRDAFIFGIHSLAWSPDGKVLAFAGQKEGTSSDLYVYDLESGNTRRLSDEIEQVQSIVWSPDSKWILYGTANWMGAGMVTTY